MAARGGKTVWMRGGLAGASRAAAARAGSLPPLAPGGGDRAAGDGPAAEGGEDAVGLGEGGSHGESKCKGYADAWPGVDLPHLNGYRTGSVASKVGLPKGGDV